MSLRTMSEKKPSGTQDNLTYKSIPKALLYYHHINWKKHGWEHIQLGQVKKIDLVLRKATWN